MLDSGLDTLHREFNNTDVRDVANIGDCLAGWKYYKPWGWDTLSEVGATLEDTLNNDHNRHGTHTSGTAAGERVGAAPEARLFHIKVVTDTGRVDDAMCGHELILDALAEGHLTGRTVVSESWGDACHMIGPGFPPGAQFRDAANCRASLNHGWETSYVKMRDAGVTAVVAAGNDGDDACFKSPAASDLVVTVAASDSEDFMPHFTNFGGCVDIVAPGTAIASAYTSHLTGGDESRYVLDFGTSMAAPLVAGAARAPA